MRNGYTELVELTRTEIDKMLRHADEVRTKLRRATRELKRFGEQVMAAREEDRATDTRNALIWAEVHRGQAFVLRCLSQHIDSAADDACGPQLRCTRSGSEGLTPA
jgi:hypothetical protein